MKRIRIKICGITRIEDAKAAADAGADAVGLVFYDKSPRNISIDHAVAISSSLPPFVTRVAVFADPEPGLVYSVIREVAPDCLQFHGRELSRQCSMFERPYIKAVRMEAGSNPRQEEAEHQAACALLLDTWHSDAAGGSGLSFDWSLVPEGLGKPVILAGGLHAGNVGEAIRRVRPFAVDVSSGVESAPGVKDPARISAFVEAVRNAQGPRGCPGPV